MVLFAFKLESTRYKGLVHLSSRVFLLCSLSVCNPHVSGLQLNLTKYHFDRLSQFSETCRLATRNIREYIMATNEIFSLRWDDFTFLFDLNNSTRTRAGLNQDEFCRDREQIHCSTTHPTRSPQRMANQMSHENFCCRHGTPQRSTCCDGRRDCPNSYRNPSRKRSRKSYFGDNSASQPTKNGHPAGICACQRGAQIVQNTI